MNIPTLISTIILQEHNTEQVKDFIGADTYIKIFGLSQPLVLLSVEFYYRFVCENLLIGTELRRYSNNTIIAVKDGVERYIHTKIDPSHNSYYK